MAELGSTITAQEIESIAGFRMRPYELANLMQLIGKIGKLIESAAVFRMDLRHIELALETMVHMVRKAREMEEKEEE